PRHDTPSAPDHKRTTHQSDLTQRDHSASRLGRDRTAHLPGIAGFSCREIEDLCTLVAEAQSSVPLADRREWPPILGLGNSVVITLAYLRRNRVQWELAETYGVSQSTVSRAICVVTPLLARALARFVPVAEELVPGRQYLVDGTLLPCWSWAGHRGLYSGKHKTTGMNVQVVC